jgi:hypothetical protein
VPDFAFYPVGMIPRILLLPAVGLLLAATVPAPPDHAGDPPRSFFESRDFVEYWSAARVLAAGGDPYDAAQLLPVQRVATGEPDLKEVVSLWTPPWTLPVYRPFGFEPFAVARSVWLALQLLLIAISVELLWRTYGGPPGRAAWLPQLLAVGFAPVFWTLFFGQNTGILLLGVSGFLYFRTRERPYLAGAFVALTALKPHVLAVFGVVLVLDAVTRSGRKTLTAGVAVIAAGAVAAAVLHPHIFEQFLAALRKPRTPEAIPLSEWQVPLLSYHVRLAVDAGAFWVQFIPCLLGCAVAVPYYWLRRRTWDWRAELPRLVLASVVLAPYGGWMFDLTVLLVPVIAGGARVTKSEVGLVRMGFAAGFVVLFLGGIRLQKLHEFLWFAPAVAALWAILEWVRVTAKVERADRPNAEPAGGIRVSLSPSVPARP